jgi:hypothetical protein
LEVDIRWKDYEVPKNRNLESVSAKNDFFLTKPFVYPPPYPHLASPCPMYSRLDVPYIFSVFALVSGTLPSPALHRR